MERFVRNDRSACIFVGRDIPIPGALRTGSKPPTAQAKLISTKSLSFIVTTSDNAAASAGWQGEPNLGDFEASSGRLGLGQHSTMIGASQGGTLVWGSNVSTVCRGNTSLRLSNPTSRHLFKDTKNPNTAVPLVLF
ncbi:unnamed protein product [Aspergillus oryzae]|uniref:Unnamed protein product n=2 Tax=Aspergillus oryzae TaxID=5062 RepID=A0AAN5C323_ASPOZ|nr:unnamed protein product [Aspergillus oryzae]GMF95404.1 unnamed protein product [Aspergillus oryzae]GMG11390.1 unnamed protein product [Aspergillus oryzae]GMG35844.1 unnamed protein product [Aspergillus oryzae]GMG48674.1 unnamed protein product [Aspergillus oryzae var. brunneus]